ncbi:hypothetical protein AgCh_032632 [Apium graveolens]
MYTHIGPQFPDELLRHHLPTSMSSTIMHNVHLRNQVKVYNFIYHPLFKIDTLLHVRDINARLERIQPKSNLSDGRISNYATGDVKSSSLNLKRSSPKAKSSSREGSLFGGDSDLTEKPVEPIKVYSEKELIREFEKIGLTLVPEKDWSIRIGALQRVEALVIGGDVFKDLVGSAFYVAPKVLLRNYGVEADVWSTGVILYILLSGVPPFLGGDILTFHLIRWPSISRSAKDLVKRMLHFDPKESLFAVDVLNHPWMKEDCDASDKPIDIVVLSRMKQFRVMNKLKKVALTELIKSLKIKQHITPLTMALEPGFLDLIKDVNGNHVLQCCLKSLGHNYNKGPNPEEKPPIATG